MGILKKMSAFTTVTKKLTTPGQLLYKNPWNEAVPVDVHVSKSMAMRRIEEIDNANGGIPCRLSVRSSGIDIMTNGDARSPIPILLDGDDELWIASDHDCVAWVLTRI
jgi:hypothetical protein